MPWDIPPILLTDAAAYAFAIQHWKAVQERAFVQGADNFPEAANVWDSGTVGSFDASTGVLTDGTKSWQTSPSHRWNNYTPPGASPWIPSYYDVVIEVGGDTDAIKVVRCFIGGNTATTLTGLNFDNYVVEGIIGSTAELVGKRYYIIKQDAPWWSDRWPEFPNAWLFDFLRVSSSTTTSVTDDARTPASTSTLRRDAWSPGRWAAMLATDPRHTAGGFDLIWKEGSTWRRAAISANTIDTLTIAATSPAPAVGSICAIIDRGGIWRSTMSIDGTTGAFSYSPKPGEWTLWYHGAQEEWFSNDVDDAMRLAQLAAATVQYETPSGPGGACQLETFTAFDVDVRIPVDSECETARAGDFFATDFWKVYRSIQLWLEQNCINWIEKKSYDGATAIPTFQTASWFKAAGINFGTTTTTAVASSSSLSASFTLPPPPTPGSPARTSLEVHYVIFNARGDFLAEGKGTATATTLTNLSADFSDPAYVGRTLIYSWGWTRDYPREFRYLYPKTYFIPDTDDDDAAVVPPEDDPLAVPPRVYPGTWITRAASTHYAEHDAHGFVTDDGPVFIDGEAARYKGDNFSDPTTPVLGPGSHGDTEYYAKAYDGQHPSATQAAIDVSRTGPATGGNDRMLEDATKHWWTLPPFGAGTMRVETGTATGGSATTLSDTSKATSAFWNAGTGRWAGFILEVTRAGTTYRTPILSMTGTTLTIRAVPGLAITAGDSYAISEPAYELNRWTGRQVRIAKLDGTTATVTITHSDDQRLYFAPVPFVIVPGMSYEIIERRHGTTWLRVGGEWVIPQGNDSRTGVAWHDNQTENLPTRVRQYGRKMRGDYNSRLAADEIYRGINVLRWQRRDHDWTNKGELNGVAMGGSSGTFRTWPRDYTDASDAWSSEMLYVSTTWANLLAFGTIPFAATVAPPFATIDIGGDADEPGPTGAGNGSWFAPDVEREFAYATISGIPTRFSSSVDFFDYAQIDFDDHDQGVETDWPDRVEYSFSAQSTPLAFRQFKQVDSAVTDGTGKAEGSTKVGDAPTTVPAFTEPADPLANSPGYPAGSTISVHSGYFVAQSVAIIKWDGPGGLKYID